MLAGHRPQFKTKEADQLGQPLFSRLLKWQTLREITFSSCVYSYEDASYACASPSYAFYASFRLA